MQQGDSVHWAEPYSMVLSFPWGGQALPHLQETCWVTDSLT